MAAITREQVEHVARLARLDLREDELAQLTVELGAILEAVSKVAELDLADVPPTSHPLDLVNAWAEDVPARLAVGRGGARERAGARRRPVPRAADGLRMASPSHSWHRDGTPQSHLDAYRFGRGVACPQAGGWTSVRDHAAGRSLRGAG